MTSGKVFNVWMGIIEPETAITDWILGLQTLYYIVQLSKLRDQFGVLSAEPISAKRQWAHALLGRLRLFFIGFCLASWLGGSYHGLVPVDHRYMPTRELYANIWWKLTIVSLGVTTLALWSASIRLLSAPSVEAVPEGRPIKPSFAVKTAEQVAVIEFIVYVAYIFITGHDEFQVAINNYLPGLLFFFVTVLVSLCRSSGSAHTLYFSIAIPVILAGSVIQAKRINLHPIYCNYNVVYHMFAVVFADLMYRGALAAISGLTKKKANKKAGKKTN